jgi:hypothetical protein
VEVHFLKNELEEVSLPVVAGVKLLPYNSGHFIVLLMKDKGRFVIADPLSGKGEFTKRELDEGYRFTGFFMSLKLKKLNVP